MYQANSGGARRVFGTGLAVGALQLGVGLVVLSAFAGGTITEVIKKNLDANDWTYVPPPTPQPTTATHSVAHHDEDTVTTPQSSMPGLAGPVTVMDGPLSLLPMPGGNDGGFLTDIPKTDPAPLQPTVAAHPLGDPGAWITPDDYPYRALREGWRGVTRLHLVIDGHGHVSSCTITASSGHEALDAVACQKVTLRAHFSPARDGTGAAHDGTYDNAIHWEIHEVAE